MMIGMGDDCMFYKNAIRQNIEQCMGLLLKGPSSEKELDRYELHRFFLIKREQFIKNGIQILKCQCKFKIESIHTVQEDAFVEFNLLFTLFLSCGEKMFHTEGCLPCKCVFKQGLLRHIYIVKYIRNQENVMDLQDAKRVRQLTNDMHPIKTTEYKPDPNPERGGYDALQAVRYAERYWNDYNPKYPRFDNDCTNYISQCLFAGGAEMVGGSDRAKGWWMRDGTWSYSWTTAQAFYLYLMASRIGLRAKVVESPKQLLLGDVICYDFEGDGRMNHTTIVVAKTDDGEPLVNAHTYNSRNRLWSYEDSSAYTKQIQYKFLQIYL